MGKPKILPNQVEPLTECPDGNPPDTIIFDLDGTLIDTLPLIYRAFNSALAPELGRTLQPNEIRAMFGPPDNQIIANLISDPDRKDAAIDRYVSAYSTDHDEYAIVYDGIPELLAEARARGSRLAVVTGKSRVTAIESLNRTGLAEYFELVLAGDDVEQQKPHPEAVLKALESLGHEPGMTGVIVGDSAADVGAGKQAGLRTIGVYWGVPEHHDLEAAQPDAYASNVNQLRGLLNL